MMTRTLSLQIDPQIGLWLHLTRVLLRHGFWVIRQDLGAAGDDGIAQLTLSVQSERPIDGFARAELLAIEGILQLAEVAGQSLDGKALQELLHRAYPGFEKAFPAVSKPVRDFALELDPEQRQRALHALGRQLGRRKSRSHYAEGSPLPLAQALQRIVTAAFRPVTAVEIQGSTVAFPDCPLCDTRPGAPSNCVFFAGMIQGLLEDMPSTRGAVVAVLSCRAETPGRDICACSVRTAAT